LKETLLKIENRMVHLIENVETFKKEQDNQLRLAILSVARKVLPDFMARNGIQEIEALLTDAIGNMLREPRLVVRVHESQFDAINVRIQDITAQKAYAGKVVLLADATFAPGDCLVEWADGGIERNADATFRDIEKAVAPDQTQNQTAGE
jgi:flagellar assembly protein FliH